MYMDGVFPVTLRYFRIRSTRSSKPRNKELPNVGYFQYCVCTPTQMKLTLTGCLFPREMNRFSQNVSGYFPSLANRSESR